MTRNAEIDIGQDTKMIICKTIHLVILLGNICGKNYLKGTEHNSKRAKRANQPQNEHERTHLSTMP